VYIEEIVLAKLGRMKDSSKFSPIFVWSKMEYEVT
jgi:hypothetical protein